MVNAVQVQGCKKVGLHYIDRKIRPSTIYSCWQDLTYDYKQVWPSAALASLHSLSVQMSVTIDSANMLCMPLCRLL